MCYSRRRTARQNHVEVDHCGEHVISGPKFKAVYARIHLAAQSSNGLCSNLCAAEDDHAQSRRQQFRKLIKTLEEKKLKKERKRKQAEIRMQQQQQDAADVMKKKRKRQPKIADVLKTNDHDAADLAVAQWALAHDIPHNALSGPYWKQMNIKLSQVGPSYTPLHRQKLKDIVLPVLKKLADKDRQYFLTHQPRAGRTLTGDGATKNKGIPLIDFLVYVSGRGVTLLGVEDCTGHISEGGIKDSLFVLLFYLLI